MLSKKITAVRKCFLKSISGKTLRVLVEAEVPGINFEDIEILVLEGDQVSIKGERKQGQKEPSAWIRKERREGNFATNLKLSCSVNIDSVEATINTGVLEIHLPKAAGHHARKIEIETA